MSCALELEGKVAQGKRQSAKFSNNDDEELIEVVSSNEILWKFSHPDYKSNMKKDLIWKKIGVPLNKSGEQCKSRWPAIRDNFKRHRKTEVSGTGQPAKKKRAAYWDRLRFLDDVEHERQGFTMTEELDSPTGMENDVVDVSLIEEVDPETNEQDISTACSPQDDCTAVQDDCGNTSSLELKVVKKAKSNPIVELMKRREETQGQLIKSIAKRITPDVPVEEDDIDIFLKSINSTIKQFTPAEKAEAKRKIFNVVSDIEVRHQASSTFHTYNYTSSNRSSPAMSNSTYSSNSANNPYYCDTEVVFSEY